MPRDLSHVILADDVCEKLPAGMGKCIDAHKTAYHMGAVSPDSFLFGSDSKLSTRMHGGLGDDTRGLVLEMLDDVRGEQNKKLQERKKAFVFGYLTHMAVDAAFHPFVYSVSGSQVPENNPDQEHVKLAKTRHRYVETWLDMHFINKKGYDFDNFRPLRKIVANVQNRREMTDFFCKNYQKNFDIKDDLRGLYKKSMTMQLFLAKVTKNQTLGKILRRLDNFLDGRLGIAVSGFYQTDRKIPEKLTEFSSYKHPVTGKTVHASIDGLRQDAVDRAALMIAAADRYAANGNRQEFLHAVPNVNLDTGIVDTRLSDIKQAQPLPVSELKGTKLDAFKRAGGIRTMPSGASAGKNGRKKQAHPEIGRYLDGAEEKKPSHVPWGALKRKINFDR